MKYLLWYKSESGFQSVHSWIDKLQATFGFHPIVIDKERGDKHGSKNGFTYRSIEDVLDNPKYKNLKWVWVDDKADTILDEYDHPEDDVIYCFGSDFEGFEGKHIKDLPGDSIKLRQDRHEEWYAVICVPFVLYDRYIYLKGRRK